MNKKLPFCKHCGANYEHLNFEGFISFNPNAEEFFVVDLCDNGHYCDVCDGETTVEWRKE